MKRTLPLAAALAALAAAPAARAEKSCCDGHSQAAASAPGSDPSAGPAAAATAPAGTPAPAPSAGASIAFPDETLLDQRGNPVKLATGAIGDRIVVMDFVFTTCTTICPLLSGIMAGVQEGLADAADVALLSVTVDPARDIPARLEAYAKKWRAGPRWTFLTGERDAVKRVLVAAGAYTASFSAHPPMVLVGDGRTGRWVRLNGFPNRARVLAEVKALRDARSAAVRTARAGGTNP